MTPRSLFAADEFLTREQAKALADRVLALAKAEETRVNIVNGWSGNTRFAGNEITTSGGSTDTTVTVTSRIGKRRGSSTTNTLDDAGLARAVDMAERLARLSPEDPEGMPELGSQTYLQVASFYDRTAELTPEARAIAAKQVIATAEAAGGPGSDLFVAGFLNVDATVTAIATSRGLFAYHRSSGVSLSTTARTPDGTGSGSATAGARDWSAIEPAALGRIAARKAVRSRMPRGIEPGAYTVVLEPRAVASIIPLLINSFDARTNDEGRGTFSKAGGGNKLGEKIADERVTIYSDPADPDLQAPPFDATGLPLRRMVYIEKGILKSLSYDRYWARQKGVPPTVGAAAGGGGGGGGNTPLKFEGGTKSVDELIAGTERGVLVTHFWYIRFLDPRTVLLTGLTRDGTFLIEKGKVTRSLKNFRWNDSPLFMLNRIEEIGRAERVSADQVMPALRVRDFNFTSLSDAV
jgi:predicted Zn-dependent protease